MAVTVAREERKEGGFVARVTIDRAAKLNALDRPLILLNACLSLLRGGRGRFCRLIERRCAVLVLCQARINEGNDRRYGGQQCPQRCCDAGLAREFFHIDADRRVRQSPAHGNRGAHPCETNMFGIAFEFKIQLLIS